MLPENIRRWFKRVEFKFILISLEVILPQSGVTIHEIECVIANDPN